MIGVARPGEVIGDVVGDEGGVTADAVDEVGAAAVLEALAEHVEARHGRDAAALADLAVERRGRGPAATGRCAGARWPRSTEVIPGRAGRPRRWVPAVGERGLRFGVEHLGRRDRCASMWASMSARTRRIRASAAPPCWRRGRRRSRRGGRRRRPADRPARTPAPAGWRGRASRWSGRPTSWRDASWRAAAGSGISSMVRSKRADAVEPPEDVHAAVAAGQAAVAARRRARRRARRGAARRRAGRRWPMHRRRARRRRGASRGCGTRSGRSGRLDGSRYRAIAGTRRPVAPAGGDHDVAWPSSDRSVVTHVEAVVACARARTTALSSSTGASNDASA